jgi:UDP-N-acetylglucosamine 2-epimerase (non-hydrolysing)
VAAKEGVRVIHVEAGLRSFDRAMPEEINRVLTDQISDLLFTTERHAQANLEREGVTAERIHFVGNVMIDTLRRNLERAVPAAEAVAAAGLALPRDAGKDGYAVVTLHRPSNVDDAAILGDLLGALHEIASSLPVIFPMHPRTRSRIEQFGLQAMLDHPGILVLPPVGYLEMLGLARDAKLVLTDSGGLQEETTALGVPCLTLRNNTERPITVQEGTNQVVGQDPSLILAAFRDVMTTGGKRGMIPEFWDGHAATRIVSTLREWL